jgi:CRISPR-associated endonuclease Csn1
MKKILGLDIGTNSIGWALIEKDSEKNEGRILGLGSRIVPMGEDKGNFESGKKITRNASRRQARGIRKLNHRYKQRRNKLLFTLYQLGLLPKQFQFAVEQKYLSEDEIFPQPEKLQHLSIKRIDPKTKQLTVVELLELRKNAIHERTASLEDLGRLIYLFNQRRGYSGGGEDEDEMKQEVVDEEGETKKKFKKWIAKASIDAVEKTERSFIKGKGDKQEKLYYFIATIDDKDWETKIQDLKPGEEYELEFLEKKNKNDTVYEISLPKKTDWRKQLESLEDELGKSGLLLGEFLYNKIKNERNYKIRERVILRKRYEAEFDAIWKKQVETNEEFSKIINNRKLLERVVEYIFPGKSDTQEKLREDALEKGFNHLIRNQIIYFQRPLKDQRDKIGNCQFEKEEKVIPKSHPLFQDFRIWQQINNLSFDEKYADEKGKIKYRKRYLSNEQKEILYEDLNEQKEIRFSSAYTKLKLKKDIQFLHGLHPKQSLRGNETLFTIRKILGNELFASLFGNTDLSENKKFIALWEIIFEVYGNEYDTHSPRVIAIQDFLKENGLLTVDEVSKKSSQLAKIKFKREYASLSIKALRNILPLMKNGVVALNESIKQKLEKLETAEYDENIENALRELYEEYKKAGLKFEFGGMAYWSATSLVYGKHTAENITSEKSFTNYHNIQPLEQNSLRNPIVEQILNEALQLVKSVWKQYKIKPDEIRVELARDLKNNAEQRKKIFDGNLRNQKTNARVKKRLEELFQEPTLNNVDKYKLWDELELNKEKFKEGRPTPAQIERYKLWEEQGQLSPYTLKPIPLSKLFDRAEYDIEHIIPKQRFFDDSFANKTICESHINKWKDNRTAFEFMTQCGGSGGLITFEDFEGHVRENFRGRKAGNFLRKTIPDDFVERQIKDTQYIAVKVKEELGRIIGTNNVKATTGGVTDYLKHHWGLTDTFKRLSRERFEQMAKTKKEPTEEWVKEQTRENNKGKAEKQLILKGWSKRLDHRHHAIDALTIACTEPNEIKRLNELNKELQKRIEEKKEAILALTKIEDGETLTEAFLKLSHEEKRKIINESLTQFPMPWKGFLNDEENGAMQLIEKIVVSHKQKRRITVDKKPWSNFVRSETKEVLRTRSGLHQDTYYGQLNGKNTYRISLASFAGKSATAKEGKENAVEKAIGKVVDIGLRKQLLYHYKINFKGDHKAAFSEEGIRLFNESRNIPVESVKIYYSSEEGEEGGLQKLDRKFNNSIYVKTGDNYCFAILEKDAKRSFDLISLFDAASLCNSEFRNGNKNIGSIISNYFTNKHTGKKLLFTLSQEDTVYFPYADETNIELPNDFSSPSYQSFWFNDDKKRWKRIYKVIKFSGDRIYFLNHNISQVIENKTEFGSQNCFEKIEGGTIKQTCIKIEVDRLGNINLAK